MAKQRWNLTVQDIRRLRELKRELSWLGWRGGKARAAALTPERRREIAQLAARARWGIKPAKEPRPPLTPEQRRESARRAALARWERYRAAQRQLGAAAPEVQERRA
jgi:hypothetical protein